jgi:hypothetical protein
MEPQEMRFRAVPVKPRIYSRFLNHPISLSVLKPPFKGKYQLAAGRATGVVTLRDDIDAA